MRLVGGTPAPLLMIGAAAAESDPEARGSRRAVRAFECAHGLKAGGNVHWGTLVGTADTQQHISMTGEGQAATVD